ncbi:hypothetical protein I317_00882 [Kwoniella heveanensis CBS 569]|nr:hypothetical protein I317_00882 [Kwoniella heveanensis CBS 569]
MTTPPSSSRLPRPTPPRPGSSSSISLIGSSSKYVSPPTAARPSSTSSSSKGKSRSRSKSSAAQPKILPFPDLSYRAQVAAQASRESSRATSPMSTPPIERLGVTFDQMVSMSRGGSSEGHSGSNGHASGSGSSRRRSSGSASGAATPTSNPTVMLAGLAGSTSPPVSSPLAIAVAQNRERAFTAPSSASPATVQSIERHGTPTPAQSSSTETQGTTAPTATSSTRSIPVPTPTRSTGFLPSSPALPRPGISLLNPPATRSTTSTTSENATQRAPIPTLSAPVTTTTAAKQSRALALPAPAQSQTQLSAVGPTTAITPVPSLHALGSHLYQAFLNGMCADVRLVVAKWGVCYHAHKMILTQASFFNTLFLGGFSETAPRIGRGRKGKERARTEIVTDEAWSGEDLELHFDDPNITRAAFEICLSRLYSPYPHLLFPTDLLPTAKQPLTMSFPNIDIPDFPSLQTSTPPNEYLTTPRLLLSLLATTTYLGLGALMREVLAMTLRTVSPVTVGRYLGFAMGDGIGEEEWHGQTEEGIKSLSNVAKIIQTDSSPRNSTDSETKVSEVSTPIRQCVAPIPHIELPSRSNSIRSTMTSDPFAIGPGLLPHFYGVLGNKIGEACGCWMARWGVDLLKAETEVPSPSYKIWAHRGLPSQFIRAVLSSDYFFVRDEMERYRVARKVMDLQEGWEEWEEEEREVQKVFADGIHYCHMTFDDLSIIASDIDPTTHVPYAPLSVLQAAHWTAADLRARVTAHERMTGTPNLDEEKENELGLMQTTSAICSSTKRRRRPTPRSRLPSPAVPSSWTGPASPSTSDTLTHRHTSPHAVYHPVPTDETHRIGASGLLSMKSSPSPGATAPAPATTSSVTSSAHGISIQGVPDFGPDLVDPNDPPHLKNNKSQPPPHGENNSFGLMGGRKTAAEIEEKWITEGGAFANSGLGFGDVLSKTIKEDRWAKIEPFRFSVEFFDVDKLSEKERFYSTTHFYAGSYFNCYVQMIKRKEKGVQLGIYLHRQSPNEPFPAPSAPRSRDLKHTAAAASLPIPSIPTAGPSSPSPHARHLSTSPLVPGSPPTGTSAAAGHQPGSLGLTTVLTNSATSLSPESPLHSINTANASGPHQTAYEDTRAVTKAFFSISCASTLGTSLIRFTSGPDCFAISQSWGWKSSALRSEEYLSAGTSPGASLSARANPADTSLEGDATEEGGGSGGGDEGVLGWTGELPYSNSSDNSVGPDQCSLRATVVVGVV